MTGNKRIMIGDTVAAMVGAAASAAVFWLEPNVFPAWFVYLLGVAGGWIGCLYAVSRSR